MAKALRESLEAKLAALDNAEWDSADSQSEESAGSDDENGRSLLLLKSGKGGKGRRGANQGPCTAPIGPDGQSSGVIYIGHIPRGFYEEAMKSFFNQFGDVLRIQLARSKKTGRYKGYGFVEFASPQVAGIVAETMNGYFLFDKQLVCSVLAFDQIHPELFKRTGTNFRVVSWHGRRRRAFNAERTPAQIEKNATKLVRDERTKRAKLAALGIEYDFPGFEAARKEGQLAPKGADDGARTTESTESTEEEEADAGGARDCMKKRKVGEDACANGKVVDGGEGVGPRAGDEGTTDEATASAVSRLSKKAKKAVEKAAAAAVKKEDGALKLGEDGAGAEVAPVLRRGAKRGAVKSTAAPETSGKGGAVAPVVSRKAKKTAENSASFEEKGSRGPEAAVEAPGGATGTAVAPKNGVKKAKKAKKASQESAAVGATDDDDIGKDAGAATATAPVVSKDVGKDSVSERSILLLAPNGVAAPDRKMDDTAVAPKKAAKKGIGAATGAGGLGAAVPPRVSKKLKMITGENSNSASTENVAPYGSDGAVAAGEAPKDVPVDSKKGVRKTKKAKKEDLVETTVNDVGGKTDTRTAVSVVSSKSAKNSGTADSVVLLGKDKASALDGDIADTTAVRKKTNKKGLKKSAADTDAGGKDTAGPLRLSKKIKITVESSGSAEKLDVQDSNEVVARNEDAKDTAVAAKKGPKKARKAKKASQESTAVEDAAADDGKDTASASVVPSKSATEKSGTDEVAEISGDVPDKTVKPKGTAKMAGKNGAATVSAGKDAAEAPKLPKKAKTMSEKSQMAEGVVSRKTKKTDEKTAAVRAAEETDVTVAPKKSTKKLRVAEEDTGGGEVLPPSSDGAAERDGDVGETAVAPKVSKKTKGKAKSVKKAPRGENDADGRASGEGEAAVVAKKATKKGKAAEKRATVGDVVSSCPDGASAPDGDVQDADVAPVLSKKTKGGKKSVKKRASRGDNEAVRPVADADGDGATGDTVLPSSSVGCDPLEENKKGAAPAPKREKKRKKNAEQVSGGEEVTSLDAGGDSAVPPGKVLKGSKGSGKLMSGGSVPGSGSAGEAEEPVDSREDQGGSPPVSSLPKRSKKGKKSADKGEASGVAPGKSLATGDKTEMVGGEGAKPAKLIKKKKGENVSRLVDKESEAKEEVGRLNRRKDNDVTSKDGSMTDVARVASNGRKASEEASKKTKKTKRAVQKEEVTQESKKRRNKKA